MAGQECQRENKCACIIENIGSCKIEKDKIYLIR